MVEDDGEEESEDDEIVSGDGREQTTKDVSAGALKRPSCINMLDPRGDRVSAAKRQGFHGLIGKYEAAVI